MVTFKTQFGPVYCDAEIAPLVKALNKAGLETVASCCGHGYQPIRITLKDRREVIILTFNQATRVGLLFPNIDGDNPWRRILRFYWDLITNPIIRQFKPKDKG